LYHGLLWADILRWIIFIAAVTVLGWLVFCTSDIDPPQGIGTPKPLPPTKHEIALAYYNAAKIYDGRALKLLVNMMVDRSYYLERITENVTLDEETPELRVATHQALRVGAPVREQASHPPGEDASPGSSRRPSAPPGKDPAAAHDGAGAVILAPIALVEKGTLLDGFTVTDADGNEVPTLSYNQTRGLLAHVVETIINMAPTPEQNTAPGAQRAAEEEKTINKIKGNLVTAICSPRCMKRKPPEEQSKIRALLDSTEELPVLEEWKERIRNFCETLVDYYVIVAELPRSSGGYALLKYTQQISVDSSTQGAINRIRSRVGLRYSAFDIPLHIFALEVDAYHMEMQAPPSQYIFDHHLEWMNSTEHVNQDDLCRGADKPYVRLRHNSAGPTAHLYVRRQASSPGAQVPDSTASGPPGNQPGLPAQRFKAVVELREIPPGTLGIATAISVVNAAIITFFALTQIGQYHMKDRSDIPALLIALPGFASVVMGSWLDLSHLRRASLSTYMGLGASVALSLAGALYFLIGADEPVPGRFAFAVTDDIYVRTSVGWLVLATLAITCCLFLVRDVVSNSRYYSNQVRERIRGHP
jgi:hypothetical protein